MEEHFVPGVPGQNMQEKNSELHRYQQESELKRKKKLSTGRLFTREKPPFCYLPIVSMKATKRLEKYKLGFLKGENLSVLLYLISRFLNYHVHLSCHQSVPPYLKNTSFTVFSKTNQASRLLSTKSYFDKTLNVIFKCGNCIYILK